MAKNDKNTTAAAVFGSSESRPGDNLYETAMETGRLLAGAGLTVVTGGYGGVMEAASRGALEAGGHTVGVTCETFSHRTPNRFVREVVHASDLFDRTRHLVDRSGAFIIMGGKAGTLAELSFLWALHRAGCLEGRPVVILDDRWQHIVSQLISEGMLDKTQAGITHYAADPRQALALVVG